ALVGGLYFFFVFAMPAASEDDVGRVWTGLGQNAGPLVIGLLASWWWLWGGHRHGLILTPAETHLLLPAPLTRGEVIRFKIMHAQPAILFSAVIVSLFMRGTGLPWTLRLLSAWVLFATLHQHQIAASLVHASADEHGRRGIRRNIVPLVLFGLAFITLMWSLLAAVADIRATGSLSPAAARLTALLAEPGPRVVLAPFRMLVAPALATSAAAWVLPFAGACLVLIAHYVWVVRMDSAFEEVAAEEGQRRAALVTAMRSGGLSRVQFAQRDRTRKIASSWLPLRPTGRAAYAVFWKNVLYAQRSIRSIGRLLLIVLGVAFVVSLGSSGTDHGDLVRFGALLCLATGGAITVIGPFTVRNDLRMDLKHIDQLRTYPLRSRDLVAAEIGAATLSLTAPQLVLVTTGFLLLLASGILNVVQAMYLTAASIVVLPVVNAVAVLVQNALALLYPSWVRLGEQDAGGMEAVGQNM
ncbi:MAG: putative ABC exporter domain-containing protein, partial [Longimicrobiales bacterium]